MAAEVVDAQLKKAVDAFRACVHLVKGEERKNSQISKVDPSDYVEKENLSPDELERLFDIGLKAVSDGQLAVVVLAGGQGTRLGSKLPKGVIPLGTGLNTSTDSLLFLQAAQISCLQKKARERFPGSKSEIIWMVMTSRATDSDVREHLDKVLKNTELNWEQVIMFVQNELPVLDINGQALIDEDSQIIESPDGNGGMYGVIGPLLPALTLRGVKYLHIYCVDNILCRVPDLHMVGSAIERGVECALKVIEKKDPNEKVGHVCVENGELRVLEYSEIAKELAEKLDPDAPEKLFLRAGNIANHFLTLDFLVNACKQADVLPFHAAKKCVAHWDPVAKETKKPVEPNAIKLERFIFDAFVYAKKYMVWQVLCDEEFSPLKNSDAVGKDCLSTCLRDFNGKSGELIRGMAKVFCD